MNPAILMPFLIEVIIAALFFISIGFYFWRNYEISKYKSPVEANRIFGAYMMNHPKRYTLSFFFMSIAAISIFPTTVVNIIAFFNPVLSSFAKVLFMILSMVSIIANVGFFITFVLIGFRYWRNYIKTIKLQDKSSKANVL